MEWEFPIGGARCSDNGPQANGRLGARWPALIATTTTRAPRLNPTTVAAASLYS